MTDKQMKLSPEDDIKIDNDKRMNNAKEKMIDSLKQNEKFTTEELVPLTAKQKSFCDNLILGFLNGDYNQTQAAISAGYSKRSATSVASTTLTKANVRAYMKQRMHIIDLGRTMEAKEIVERLEKIARREERDEVVSTHSTSYDAYINVNEGIEGAKPEFKKVTFRESIPMVVDVKTNVRDATRGLELLGKHHKLFDDKTDINAPEGLKISVEYVTPNHDLSNDE